MWEVKQLTFNDKSVIKQKEAGRYVYPLDRNLGTLKFEIMLSSVGSSKTHAERLINNKHVKNERTRMYKKVLAHSFDIFRHGHDDIELPECISDLIASTATLSRFEDARIIDNLGDRLPPREDVAGAERVCKAY